MNGNRPPFRGRPVERLEAGRRVLDSRHQVEGTVLDFACQYAHPKAEPVYSYLVRWDDGRVTALSEAAFEGEQGYEPID